MAPSVSAGEPRVPDAGDELYWKGKGIRGALRFKWNLFFCRRLWLLNQLRGTITVINGFGFLGDTLLTATICRNIKTRFPRVRINCITRHAELLLHDPHIDTLNQPETLVSVRFAYLDVIHQRDKTRHILADTFRDLGLEPFDVRAKVYLTAQERTEARLRLGDPAKPILTFNAGASQPSKCWRWERWQELCRRLAPEFCLVQLGTEQEPDLGIEGIVRFAGRLSPRESMAVLSWAHVHVGVVSFLMHGANGLGIPSVILYGGRETPANSGYGENANLYVEIACGPCWVESFGQTCPHDMQCMKQITVQPVYSAIQRLARARAAVP